MDSDVVTCLALSQDGSTLVTGSADTTVMLWDLPHALSSSAAWPEHPRKVLFGHDDEVTCIAVNSAMDVVVSGSKDGTMIVHELKRGRYIRTISLPSRSVVSLLELSTLGDIVALCREDMRLYRYSINGRLLKSVDVSAERPAVMMPYYLRGYGELLISGGERGSVFVRSFDECVRGSWVVSDVCSLTVALRRPIVKQGIVDMDLAPDQKHLLIGCEDGTLVVFPLIVNIEKEQIMQRSVSDSPMNNLMVPDTSGDRWTVRI